MSDYDYETYEDEPVLDAENGDPSLPGGVSLQTAAAILLVAVVLATLYLFFGPMPGGLDEAASEPTPTSDVLTDTLAAEADETAASDDDAAGTEEDEDAGAPTVVSPPTPVRQATSGSGSASPTTSAASVETPAPPDDGTLRDGGFARVSGTGIYGLRIRFGPGEDFITIRFAEEQETLRITGGPERQDEITWWRVQDGQGNVGWVAADYLVPTAAPASWNPPSASPTFETDAGSEGVAPGGTQP